MKTAVGKCSLLFHVGRKYRWDRLGARLTRLNPIGRSFKGSDFLFAVIGLRLLPRYFKYEAAAGGLSFGKSPQFFR